MARNIDARTVKAWLSDGREIAFLDVREHGQYGEAHPFLATSVAYSRFELALPSLAPNAGVRMVLLDDGSGVAERAARRAEALGYRNVHVLDGGAEGWKRAGYVLFAGVNVPSKTFGELVEIGRHTPRVTATELQRMVADGQRLVIVDGRPFTEFERMCIPGGICCPNGEMALRMHELVPDPTTTIVVNCAGRTRSIIGAETLRDLGLPNKVLALENGTQGWFLAGLELERGARRRHSQGRPAPARLAEIAGRLRATCQARGVGYVSAATVTGWLAETERTTFVIDVRSPEEFAAGSAAIAVSAPGGQLIQATDQWVGVKGARIVLLDDDGVRAPMAAQWLAQLGHDVSVLEGGVAAADGLVRPPCQPAHRPAALNAYTLQELAAAKGNAHVVDVRPSTVFRAGHIEGATWGIRPRLALALPADKSVHVVLAGDGDTARLAAIDAAEQGHTHVSLLDGDLRAWRDAGLAVVASPDVPADAQSIDYLFFVHDRHDGNAAAARRYLEWETGLLAQLDDDERGLFKVAALG